ncbi:hypothetical protein CK203_014315 [Vitis vinifera]|uniref:Uncharacterized protein n=1 Tax=Vitis vinifera TaxID=29760 RepID=A0A438K4T2_VITVI|nr:hypothetical protein CK203_014315 [Vitis vinifera]
MKKWHDQLISNKEFQEGKEFYCMTQDSIAFLGSSSQESMDIVSSHSWSHLNQKKRKSTSLNLKKPKQRRVEEISRKLKEKNRIKSEQKQSENRAKTELCEISQAEENFCEMSILLPNHSATLWKSLREFSQLRKRVWHTSATSQHRSICFAAAKRIAKRKGLISQQKSHSARVSKSERAILAGCSSPSLRLTMQASGHLLRLAAPAKFRQPEMAQTRGAKYSSPSNRKRSLRKEPVLDPVPEPSQPKAIPPPVKPVPPKPPMRRYLTRSGVRLQFPRRVPCQFHLRVPSPAPQTKPQEPQPPLPKPQIPAEIAPEEVIRRPMLTQPPIEGNLDCRARPFHSELFFDIAAFRVRPELTQSFNLLRRYHMEHLLTPRDFFYPRIAMDFYQSMTTNQHWTQRRGVLLEALYKMSEGFFFGPHHLILAALLYFEEKVHKKKLQRANCIPPSFQGCLCQILEHLGYPSKPQLERKRICRDLFTLNKWNNMTAYKVDQPEQPQPAARRASPRHIPEGIIVAAPAIPRALPAAPASSQPSTSAELRMAIPISEYRELLPPTHCHLKAAPASFHLPPAVEPSTSTPAEPHSHPSESHLQAQAPAEALIEEADPSA